MSAVPVAKKLFDAIAMKANRSKDGSQIMKEWVGHYYGKVIQFETDVEKFHIVITDGKMKVLEGVYPAPDLTFKGSSRTISEVFTGRKRMGDAMKTWELTLIGAGHEGFALGRLVTTVMLEV
jgi:putative sterol carrier protein